MTKLYFDLLNSPAEAHSSIQKSLSAQALSTTIPILEFPSETVYAYASYVNALSIGQRIDPAFTQSLTSAISNLAGRPVAVSDIYQKIHETTLRTPVEMGVRPNSITLEEYQIAINQQAISMVQDMQDGDKGEKVEALQANMQFLYGQEINTDFVARNELAAGQRAKTVAIVQGHITIGYGFDTFVHEASELNSLNLVGSTRQKVLPALQLSTSDPSFWSVYASLGQRLTDDDGLLLFSAKARAVVQHLAGDQFSGSWEGLPAAVKTVVLDLYYQYGQWQKFPKFQQAIISHDWPKAIHELRNWNGMPNDPNLSVTKRLEERAKYLAISFNYEQ
ncbi:pesticin C-terminus-like muramidase [Pseudomonas paraeruginosa]|uniref:pesticin C-terminus-like muramidase n=1 Tax=Pseudomonas paraeruginosa TaxID=2994495 RepID=UPI001ED9A1AE|nr:pesticin C-terminus-like muramidase [Pseudomonas paraeruginosa]